MAEGKAKKMWALPGAVLTAPQALLMHGGDATMMLDLPCPSFLIDHPKGLVLFDTGCNPKVIDDAVGYWGDVAAHLPIKWSKADTLVAVVSDPLPVTRLHRQQLRQVAPVRFLRAEDSRGNFGEVPRWIRCWLRSCGHKPLQASTGRSISPVYPNRLDNAT